MLDEIIELAKPYIISIEEGGSRVNPFIRNPKDRDVCFIVESEEIKKELSKVIMTHFHFRQMREAENLDVKIRVAPNNLSELVYGYLSKFMKPFDGYEKKTVELPIDEETIKNSIIKWITYINNRQLDIYKQKPFYHVYTSMCIMKHNSYDLIEEEIDNINILHDMKEEDEEVIHQLIDSILEEVNLWQQK